VTQSGINHVGCKSPPAQITSKSSGTAKPSADNDVQRGYMQITNNIEIICNDCGTNMPVCLFPEHDIDRNTYTFKVMPCPKCAEQANTVDGKGDQFCKECGCITVTKCMNCNAVY